MLSREMLTLLLICLQGSATATSQVHINADGSMAEARRMMRVEDTSLQQDERASGQRLAAINSHGAVAETEATEADHAQSGISSFVECSVEGGTCECDGVVLYGRGTSNWKELRAEGSVLCTAALFDTIPAPEGEVNVCRCYSLHWCAENNVDKLNSDGAHRRRNAHGIPGRNLHQRRRWCGWGPRDCAWSSWSKWSDCSGGKQCAETGISRRTREVEMEADNGGGCKKESTSEETQCHWVGCKDKNSTDGKDGNDGNAEVAADEATTTEQRQRQKRMASARAKLNKSLAEAESAVAKSADLVEATAAAAGAAADLASEARSKVLSAARAETGLTPTRLGRIAAEEFLPVVRTVSSEVRAKVVSLAGEVILIGMGKSDVEDLETPQVVSAAASKIADALGLLAPTTSAFHGEPDGLQVFGADIKTSTVAPIQIFPKDLADEQSLQG